MNWMFKPRLPIFFADLEHDISQMSPYNPDVKRLYRIDCVKFENTIYIQKISIGD